MKGHTFVGTNSRSAVISTGLIHVFLISLFQLTSEQSLAACADGSDNHSRDPPTSDVQYYNCQINYCDIIFYIVIMICHFTYQYITTYAHVVYKGIISHSRCYVW